MIRNALLVNLTLAALAAAFFAASSYAHPWSYRLGNTRGGPPREPNKQWAMLWSLRATAIRCADGTLTIEHQRRSAPYPVKSNRWSAGAFGVDIDYADESVDVSGNPVTQRAVSNKWFFSFKSPAWYLVILLAAYPAFRLIKKTARRRPSDSLPEPGQ